MDLTDEDWHYIWRAEPFTPQIGDVIGFSNSITPKWKDFDYVILVTGTTTEDLRVIPKSVKYKGYCGLFLWVKQQSEWGFKFGTVDKFPYREDHNQCWYLIFEANP